MVQVLVALPEDLNFKRDAAFELREQRVTLSVLGSVLLDGEWSHAIVPDETEWFIEEDVDGFESVGASRFLDVRLRKVAQGRDWQAPILAIGAARSASPTT